MKDFLNKLISMQAIPIKLIGTTLIELLLFALAVIGLVGVLSYLWSANAVIMIWLFTMTLWGFLHIKRSALIQDQFDEIDQRDLDFRDECDRHFAKLEAITKKLKTTKRPSKKSSL